MVFSLVPDKEVEAWCKQALTSQGLNQQEKGDHMILLQLIPKKIKSCTMKEYAKQNKIKL